MPEFTAIDFETANRHRSSPCQVGLVKVKNGEIVEETSWLIKPPEEYADFDPFNISIHGITSDAVINAPDWQTTIGEITEFAKHDVLVAHNASFDISVLRRTSEVENVQTPRFEFACTLATSRRLLSLPSYRLPFVSEALGVELTNHHDGLADARAAAQIALALCGVHGLSTISALVEHCGINLGLLADDTYRSCGVNRSSTGNGTTTTFDIDIDVDPDGYFHGKTVVFTGALQTMPRTAAIELVKRAGGEVKSGTTKQTNILVVGSVAENRLRPGEKLSVKAERAVDLQAAGQDIEVITESDFLQLLQPPEED